MERKKILSYTSILFFYSIAQSNTSEINYNNIELRETEALNAQKMATTYYNNTQSNENVVHEMENNLKKIEKEKDVLQNKFMAAQKAQEKIRKDKEKLLNLAYKTFAKKHKMYEIMENNKKLVKEKKQKGKKIFKLAKEAKEIAAKKLTKAAKKLNKAKKLYKSTEMIKEKIKLAQKENQNLKNKLNEEIKRTEIWKDTFKLTRNSNKKLRDYNNKILNKKRNYKKQFLSKNREFLSKNHEYLKLNKENLLANNNLKQIRTKLNQTLGDKPKNFNLNDIDYYLDKAVPHLVKSLRIVCKWLNRSVLENPSYKLDKKITLNSLLQELNNGMQLSHNKFEKLIAK